MPRPTLAVLATLSLALLGPQPGVAQPQPVAAGRVVEVEVPAPSLAGNLLQTPTIQGAAVYLPPSYDLEPRRRYPVIYLLHGIFDSYGVWLDHFGLPEILDRLILSGELPELLMVMPNGGNVYGGGFYRNSPVSGGWADFVVEDLVGYVDGHYRTLAARRSRAVTGHSMGGYGAIHLAMTRPDAFSVVWAMSPCCLAPVDDLGFGNDSWKRAAGVESPDELPVLFESNAFYAVAALGVLAAFSPDPAAPPMYLDFPFDVVRGETVLDDSAYDRYLDAFPVRGLPAAREALRGLTGLAMGVGLGDQFLHIPTGTLELSQRLGEARIPHLLDVYSGDHRQEISERLERVVLPWVGERLAVEESATDR